MKTLPLLTLSCLVLGSTACPGDDGPSTSESSSGPDPTTSTSGPSTLTVDPTGGDSSTTDQTGTSGTTSSADSTDGTTSTGEDSTTTSSGCMGGEVLCDGECIDPSTSLEFCGAVDDCMGANAGTACGMDQECNGGQCECTVGLLCGGECIDPQVDPLFCGASGDCQGANAGEECTLSAACLAGACAETCDNCSFETGDFTGWTTVDLLTPYIPLSVSMGGDMAPDFPSFTTAPTDGSFCAITGFDGDGPGTIEIGQDITLAPAPPADLVFDYRAGWELAMFGATLDRTLEVQIEPPGGGVPMDTVLILTAPAGNLTTDTGDLMGMVDLSPY
ncbi:MAG: hypothetical protein KDK70_07650, partial [Myxococcales bacterium]|nr:hypothetical protein [Myxococcales bacterium]